MIIPISCLFRLPQHPLCDVVANQFVVDDDSACCVMFLLMVCVQVELKHQYKVRIFMDESVSFGTLGATGHGVTEHLNVPVCGRYVCCPV